MNADELGLATTAVGAVLGAIDPSQQGPIIACIQLGESILDAWLLQFPTAAEWQAMTDDGDDLMRGVRRG